MNDLEISPLVRVLTNLDSDTDASGWDQPARIYALLGSTEDPFLALLFTAGPGHPLDYFEKAAHGAVQVPSQAIGIVAVVESWRVLAFEEIVDQFPTIANQMLEELRRITPASVSDEDFFAEIGSIWIQAAAELGVNHVRPELVKESRVSIALADNMVTSVMMDRYSSSPNVSQSSLAESVQLKSRLIDVLQQFCSQIGVQQ